MNEHTQVASTLLACCAAPEGGHEERAQSLGPEQWRVMVELAIEHRVAPILHQCLSNSVQCPAEVRERLTAYTRETALQSLAQAKGLVRAVTSLAGAGFDSIALKGASLAFRDYPQPQLRPLRDVDLLLPADQVEAAQEALLRSGGYRLAPWAGRYDASHSHQLPEIIDDETGLVIELHHRLSAVGWEGDHDLTKAVWREAETIEIMGLSVRVPSPEVNLLHLVEHAALHHLFSNGPLILSDLHFLATSRSLDWSGLVVQAQALGLFRSLQLIAAVAHRHGASWIPEELDIEDVPVEHIEHAEAAILDGDEQHRRYKLLMRQVGRTGSVSGQRNAIARAFRPDRNELARLAQRSPEDPLRWFGFPRWLIEKGSRYLAASADAQLLGSVEKRQALRDWMVVDMGRG